MASYVQLLYTAAAFVFLRFILPSIDFGSMAANAFAKGLSGAAPFVVLVLSLPAPVAALNSWIKRKHHTRK